MANDIQTLTTQLTQLPPARQAMLAATAAGSIAFFAWLVFGAAAPDYRALYRGLPPEEVARVSEALAAERIDYQLADGGTSVLVSAPEVAEARIRLASKGLPSGGNTGFELFDEPAFGVTNFVHRVNYLRAVQGELARSIEQLDPVERARVQVVIPERGSVLSRLERRPSASAVIGVKPGRELDREQVRAVVHLIASGIESLDPSQVTVVDGSGRLLAPLDDGRPGAARTAGVSGYQERVEAQLSERIQSMLEKTVGAGGVVARVRADLDWSEVETTEETFDPDSQVARSERRSTEANNEELAGGVPGVTANIPGSAGPTGGASGSSRETETINYEISKSVSRRTVPSGQIERLSIAVLVADPVAPAAGADGEEPVEAAPAPWSVEDLALFEAIARQAAGFDEKRGDQITVRSAPFRLPGAVMPLEDASFWPQWSPLLLAALKGVLALVALVLFARLVIAPLAQSIGTASSQNPALPARLAELETQLAAGNAGGGGVTAGALGGGAQTEDAARTLRTWLNQS